MCYTMFLMSHAIMLGNKPAENPELHIAGFVSNPALHIFTSNSNWLVMAKVQPLQQQPCCAIFVVLIDWTSISFAMLIVNLHASLSLSS